jgi:hypothetical protein
MRLLIKESTTSTYQIAPVGVHLALCTWAIDMGVQDDSKFKPRRKLYLSWELPDQCITWTDKNGQERSGPMRLGKTYTMSLAPKSNLRADIEGWRGRVLTESETRAFDIMALIEKPCLLVVSHRDTGDRVYANITAVAPAPKGAAPKASGKVIAYNTDDPDPEAFDLLPEWLQKKIRERKTDPSPATSAPPVAPVAAEFDDAIPF